MQSEEETRAVRKAYHKRRYEADPEKYRALARAAYDRRKASGYARTEEEAEKQREAARLSARRHPETARRRRLMTLYGLTIEAYDALLASQGGGCAICGDEPWTQPRGVLHVDHDHATGRVRGLLCQPCNHALGSFRDRADLLQGAITYLTKGIL